MKAPSPVWVVIHNLSGLQKEIELFWNEESKGYFDKTGMVGGFGILAQYGGKGFLHAISTEGYVVNVFGDRMTAVQNYDALRRYRDHLQSRL